MRLLLLGVLLLLLVAPVAAAGKIPFPPVGELGGTQVVDCDGQLLEVRFYDYDPPDPEKWQGLGLGLAGEPDFLRAYFTAKDESPVFLDADRDGYAESVTTWGKAKEQYRTWCGAYEQIRKGL